MNRIPQYKPDEFKSILDLDWAGRSMVHQNLNAFFIEPLKVLKDAKTPSQPHRKTVNDFVFIKKGSLEKMVCSDVFTIQKNMVVILPPYKIRTFLNNTPDVEGFYCHFSDEFISEGIPGLKYLQDILSYIEIRNNPTLYLDDEHQERIDILLQNMTDLYMMDNDSELVRIYLFTLLGEIRHFIQGLPKRNLSINETLVFRFRRLITHHIQQVHAVKEYADLLNVSPNHLNKSVKKVTGKTASDIINEALLMEAKALLSSSLHTVSEVAFAVGIDDVSYFSRLFKKHTGVSPSEYQKRIDLSY
ncbi:helix-turn-helix domain-containing protein [Chryseobacterium sp. c4a]|uniref:helix-turn-helix domain-containing protein n=1 Tax=Chryseobacterium sp. c4a TaxID=1573582 RepID=UPI001358151A|nr:AraC family transcriptional regulator [Chryseobacterium sp. c4a]